MDELLEFLAEGSHRSWMADKQRQGFADHAYASQCAACQVPISGKHCGRHGCFLPNDKHHPDMLPYSELPEHIKEYDRASARGVLKQIEAAGYRLVRATD